jgi:uncharacterized repeat protein (TIGR03803 family)
MLRFKELRRAILGVGLLLPLPAAAATVTPIASVFASNDGYNPSTGVVEVGDTLYGTVATGGSYNLGLVYAVDRKKGTEAIVYSFKGGADGAAPKSALIYAGGLLYGTTYSGGASNQGTVFKLDPSTGVETVLYAFQGGSDSGAPTQGLTSVGSLLYGVTASTLFSVDPSTGAETVLHTFGIGDDGKSAFGPLLNVGDKLYGVTYAGGQRGLGTVYAFDLTSGQESVVHSFVGPDGSFPSGSLVSKDGKLYGATLENTPVNGRGCGAGGVFRMNPTSGDTTLIYAFECTDGASPLGGLIEVSGALYGTTMGGGPTGAGYIFKTIPSTGITTDVASFSSGAGGSNPYDNVIYSHGTFYGTTQNFSTYGTGAVFAADAASGEVTALHAFTGVSSGYSSTAALLPLNGSLFLTSNIGGAYSLGAVTKIDPASGTETILHSFTGGADGGTPLASVVPFRGKLYGTGERGGATGNGVVFSVDPQSGKEKVVYSFAGGSDGAAPVGGLLSLNGRFYGTTSSGGASGFGTVFALDPATGLETVLHSFTSSDGANPVAGVVNVGGVLWGTTVFGGASNGTVFKIDPASGIFTHVYTFPADGKSGVHPLSPLVSLSGMIYGSTPHGGPKKNRSEGTIFSIDPTTGAETTVFDFDKGAPKGHFIIQGLLQAGKALFGVDSDASGEYGCGMIFKLRNKPSGGFGEKVVYDFTCGSDGAAPVSALVRVKGIFYGVTGFGGQAGLGLVYSLTP